MTKTEPLRMSSAQAAEALGVTTKTLWAYVNAGILKAITPNGRGPGCRIYFSPDEIKRFAQRSK